MAEIGYLLEIVAVLFAAVVSALLFQRLGLGTVLGEAQVNIGTFHLGRTEPGGDAIALVEVDGAVPPEVLKAVANLPNVVQAKALSF